MKIKTQKKIIDFIIFSIAHSTSIFLFFFSNKGVFSKIWGHPAHTEQVLLTQHFYSSDESNLRAKQIKNIHSFNCFIQPALPWIIYVAPPTIRLYSLRCFTLSLASGMVRPQSLRPPFTPSIHLLLGLSLPLLPSTSAR